MNDLAATARLRENPRAMPRLRTHTKFILLIAGGLLLALAVSLVVQPSALLIAQWQQELNEIPDEEVLVRLTQIAAAGDRGVPVLVGALHSERRALADTAFQLLQQYLDEQELESAGDSSPRIAALASELGRQSGRRGAFSAASSIKLATRLLLWPTDDSKIDNEQLVADCEAVIRTFAVDKASPGSPSDSPVAATEYRQLSAVDIVSSGILDLPGGGVMTELVEIPEPPREERELPSYELAVPVPIEPLPFTPAATRNIRDVPADRERGQSSQPSPDEAVATPQRNQGVILRRDDWTPVPRQSSTPQPLSARSELEVMRQLASNSLHATQLAINELKRRGFRSRELQLAEQLASPDPAVRIELANNLPQLTGIDSRRWLMWLSSDPDAIVRRSAISIMSTGDDPAIFDHLRKVEQTETDAEVLQLIRRVLANRP